MTASAAMTAVTISLGVMVVAVFAAAYSDLRTRRIPNQLTAAVAVVALAAHTFGGLSAVGAAAAAMVAVFLAGTVAFSFRIIGGGDVKLLAACSAVAAFPGCISLLLFTFIAGGVVAIFESVRRRRLRAVISGTLMMAVGGRPTERFGVPYGVAIALGSFAYALSVTVAPFMRLPL